jgi:hypothetical protein
MSLYLPDLDLITRDYMAHEFDVEQAGRPYVPTVLSAHGRAVWPALMRDAITSGDDVTLLHGLLAEPSVFNREESYRSRGVVVYRASEPKWAVASCSQHEGHIVPVRKVYDGHRSRYWPTEDLNAFSIPFQPGCHHSIRRTA